MIELNKVLLVGRLTRDPETRYTSGGSAVANFSIAVNRRWKDRQSGERREEVAYIDCEAWGPRAEFVQQWFHKGKAIFVEGRLKQDSWEDKQSGQKRSKLLVSVDNASFVSGDRDEEGDGNSGGGGGSRGGNRGGSGGGGGRYGQSSGGSSRPRQQSRPADDDDDDAQAPADDQYDDESTDTEDDLPF